jgi:hypothetical protein
MQTVHCGMRTKKAAYVFVGLGLDTLVHQRNEMCTLFGLEDMKGWLLRGLQEPNTLERQITGACSICVASGWQVCIQRYLQWVAPSK